MTDWTKEKRTVRMKIKSSRFSKYSQIYGELRVWFLQTQLMYIQSFQNITYMYMYVCTFRKMLKLTWNHPNFCQTEGQYYWIFTPELCEFHNQL